jgi:hypothetical protein
VNGNAPSVASVMFTGAFGLAPPGILWSCMAHSLYLRRIYTPSRVRVCTHEKTIRLYYAIEPVLTRGNMAQPVR